MGYDLAYVDDMVAFSPSPCGEEEIRYLSKFFKNVVVLVEKKELCYDLNLWKKFGVDIVYLPVKDYRSPNMIKLHRIASWITKNALSGKRYLSIVGEG